MSKATKILSIILGAIMIVTGVICLFTPGQTYLVVGYMVGIAMICDAIGRFITWWELRKVRRAEGWLLACSIISAFIGFFILNSSALQLGIDAFIAYYIAIWLIFDGILVAMRSFKVRKFHKNWDTVSLGSRWYVPFIFGILMIVFGVLCCFNPVIMASLIGIFIGLGIICAGANLITMASMPEKPNRSEYDR